MYRTMTGRGFSTRASTLGPWRYPAFISVLLLALICTVVPMVVLVMGTFMTAFGYFDIPRPWTFDNWRRVLADPLLIKSLQNTLVVGLGAAAIGVAFYSLVAYVIVKTKFAGRHAMDLLSWLPWAIPGILMGLALLWTVFQTRFLLPIYGTVWILVLALIIKSMPLGVQLLKSVLMQFGDELEEASRIAGGSWLQTYRRVVIPLLLPTIIIAGLVSFMSAARDISTVVLLGSSESRTLALLMLDFGYGGQFEKGTVVAVITVILVIVAAVLARIVGGQVGLGRHTH
jgi:iron(III) transport system permease protein